MYSADQLLNDQYELFVTRVDGSIPTRRLSTPLFARGDVRTFTIGADLERVLYEADRDAEQVFQLFSVPLSGSSALGRELTPPLSRATKVMASRLTPDGASALWVDRAFQLWSAPADGHAPARLLHGGFPSMRGISPFDFQPTLDSTRAVYLADPSFYQRWELFSVPLAGGSAPVRLHPPLIRQRRVWSFQFAPDGRSLAYIAAQEADDRRELFLVPADGSAAPCKLNARLVAGGSVARFQFGATEREGVYLADQETDGVRELYATVLPAPVARPRPR